jgi:peptide deformylase
MAVRPILIYPDPRLRKVCESVACIDDHLRKLIDDMCETMYSAPGIGLAAPQIGVASRIFVMDGAVCDEDAAEQGESEDPSEQRPIAFINPEILEISEEKSHHNEGCLSIPEQYEDVERPAEVVLKWLDPGGVAHRERFTGLGATCVQHEMDHLNGRLFIDYIGPVRRAMITEKMKKMKKNKLKERTKLRNSRKA